jgi:hypothetical protein
MFDKKKTNIFSVLDIYGPPLWSSGSIPGTTRFSEMVGLERGPLSLASTVEELLERKGSGSGLENRDCGRRDTLC